MNENEINSQNFPSMHPISPNGAMGGQAPDQIGNKALQAVPVAPSQAMEPTMTNQSQPMPSRPVAQPASMNNFMDNFVDAVVQKTEPANIPMQQASTSQMTASVQPVQSATEPVGGSAPVIQTEVVTPVPLDSNTEAERQQEVPVQENTATSPRKKDGHWKFILILFAIVGGAILLFQYIVQIFGY